MYKLREHGIIFYRMKRSNVNITLEIIKINILTSYIYNIFVSL